ncbi:hypothetical protein GGR56DRAFT_382278 [Xylariaceae sp. FL0804]|nr:hypothetical protein GGR56DRAFT_382278 [Xylariaceae sp. FL0804]
MTYRYLGRDIVRILVLLPPNVTVHLDRFDVFEGFGALLERWLFEALLVAGDAVSRSDVPLRVTQSPEFSEPQFFLCHDGARDCIWVVPVLQSHAEAPSHREVPFRYAPSFGIPSLEVGRILQPRPGPAEWEQAKRAQLGGTQAIFSRVMYHFRSAVGSESATISSGTRCWRADAASDADMGRGQGTWGKRPTTWRRPGRRTAQRLGTAPVTESSNMRPLLTRHEDSQLFSRTGPLDPTPRRNGFPWAHRVHPLYRQEQLYGGELHQVPAAGKVQGISGMQTSRRRIQCLRNMVTGRVR